MMDLLHLRFIEIARRQWSSFCMSDSTGKELSYGKALIGGLLLARWMRKQRPADSMVGLLLPASVGGALANIAVLMAGKIPVNLNFTVGREVMASAIQQCGIRTILTSRHFLEKAKLEEMGGMVFLEDVLKEIKPFQKILTAMMAFLFPSRLIQKVIGSKKARPDDLATVIFSSGSTGIPKGVMLSHRNILSNVEGLAQIFWLTRKDRLMGVLPFFHSFGFTGTLWFPLITGFGVIYHPNPMDAKTVGEMVSKYKATMLLGTPTFCAAYLKKCSKEEFSSLRYAIVGAEKLNQPLANAFKEKYGIDLLEEYGCTEMAPVVSVNIPDVESREMRKIGHKPGTVGRPIPGVTAKVVDLETGEPLLYGREGLLLLKGPNRMIGYLGQPGKTKVVLRDGWYVTGDIASIDEDGFIKLTDRLSRFSKIGGEMVPHIKVEEVVNRILGEDACVVTALPDVLKGEQIVILYTNKELTPEEIWRQLCNSDLPRLWIPKRDHILCIESIPTLGSGKVDLQRVRIIARERAAVGSADGAAHAQH